MELMWKIVSHITIMYTIIPHCTQIGISQVDMYDKFMLEYVYLIHCILKHGVAEDVI